MTFPDHPLGGDGKGVVEDRRGKALAPDFIAQDRRQSWGELARGQSAVGLEGAFELRRRELLTGDGFEGGGEPG